MGAQGTATLDFGAFPGSSDATVAVTGQTAIVGGSLAEAWVVPADTADHTIDEHTVEPPAVFVINIVAGTGFTIRGVYQGGGQDTRTYGQWNIGWVWN